LVTRMSSSMPLTMNIGEGEAEIAEFFDCHP
jgi:hypothetical protein